MTKARTIADLGTGFVNISDSGTVGTKVASGTTGQRGSTAGQIRFNTTTGLAEYYTGTDFKIIDTPPTVTAVSPLEVDSQAGGNITFTITGSNFQSGAVTKFIGNDATEITASTTTINSSSSISAIIARSSFVSAKEPYDVRVLNTSGLTGTLDNQINVDSSPTWSTASGTLATINDDATGTHSTVSATDIDGDTISYSETGGTVLTTAGLTLNSSTGAISGNPTDVGSSTTYSFNLRATANSKTVDRAFSIIINPSISGGNFTNTYSYGGTNYKIIKFTSTGNLILGASKTLDYLIIGGGGSGGHHSGGGGGSGGLVFFTNQTLSAGTYTATIGNGGQYGTGADKMGTNGANSSFNSHIALGGGGGAGHLATGTNAGLNGGSGGGGQRGASAGSSIQFSTYGYGTGNSGASSGENNSNPNYAAYAGGGTGTAGNVRLGGNGKTDFISSSTAATTAFLLAALAGTDASNNATTSGSTGTLYIGGGGGGSDQSSTTQSNLNGGFGGGGNGGQSTVDALSGLVNTGSGGGGQSAGRAALNLSGGSGIVIIRFQI